jgi:hypothetical protein
MTVGKKFKISLKLFSTDGVINVFASLISRVEAERKSVFLGKPFADFEEIKAQKKHLDLILNLIQRCPCKFSKTFTIKRCMPLCNLFFF